MKSSILTIFVITWALAISAGCGGTSGSALDGSDPRFANTRTTRSGLKIVDLEFGGGLEAVEGSLVVVHYTGRLEDGTKFDSSLDRGEPFVFDLGAGQVIKGWDEGVLGMKVGGKRKLIVPPKLGYGVKGAGDTIPSNSTLVFEIELLEVE